MYRYVGNGFIVGIPARDISEEEFKSMDKARQEIIKHSALYELVKSAAAQEKTK